MSDSSAEPLMPKENFPDSAGEVVLHGIASAPGIAVGPVRLHGNFDLVRVKIKDLHKIQPSDVQREIELYDSAVKCTVGQIANLRQRHIKKGLNEGLAKIWDAHLLIVKDPVLRNSIIKYITTDYISAGEALNLVVYKFIDTLSAVKNEYWKERVSDIKDVALRLLRNLTGLKKSTVISSDESVIAVAKSILPSDMFALKEENVLGIFYEEGGTVGHTAILSRSFHIPAVTGIPRLCDRVKDGDIIILDGQKGTVILNPKPETLKLYREKQDQDKQQYQNLIAKNSLQSDTLDGFHVKLLANVEGCCTSEDFSCYGAEGIGLFRTEYFFLTGEKLPDEEFQYLILKKQLEQLNGASVVVRTQDIGGDKIPSGKSSIDEFKDPNPFLGMRAIRLMRKRPEIMREQMKAVLRASAFGDIRLLFPMISNVDEVDFLSKMLEQCKTELRERGTPFNENLKKGIMIEVPSAALCADALAEKVDFFSIGTNDLVQYTLAVDRTNKMISYLYNPADPAVLFLISRTVRAAQRVHIPVCVCGEMAADPLFTPFFIGLGIDELSMSPVSIAKIRQVIRNLRHDDLINLADDAADPAKNRKTMQYYRNLISKIDA